MPSPVALRQLVQKRDEQASGTSAEVEDAQVGQPVGHKRERGLDDGLGLGARLEGLGRERERKAPEFAPAQDAADRLAGEAAAGEAGEARRRFRAERA